MNTLVLIVKLKKNCSTRRRGVPTLGEFISTATTKTMAASSYALVYTVLKKNDKLTFFSCHKKVFWIKSI